MGQPRTSFPRSCVTTHTWLCRVSGPHAVSLVLGVLVAFLASCSQQDPTAVSLLDGQHDSAWSAPWKTIKLENRGTHLYHGSVGLRRVGSRLFQSQPVSLMRVQFEVPDTGLVVIHLSYDDTLREAGRVEVSLRTPASTATLGVLDRLDGGRFTWQCPNPGEITLELRHHVPIGSEIPLQYVVVGEIGSTRPSAEREQLDLVLAWVAERYDHPRPLPDSRLVTVAGDGCTRRGVLASAGVPAMLDAPRGSGGRDLSFAVTALTGVEGDAPSVNLEGRYRGGWTELWSGALADSLHWQGVCIEGNRIPNGIEAFRFTSEDSGVLACLAEPVLGSVPPLPRRLNLILVDLDTVRADRLGIYGYTHRPTSARLDSILCARGFTVFGTGYAPCSWTLSSTAKFLSSRYLHDTLRNNISSIPSDLEMLAETLRGNGYYCAAFTGGGVLRTPGFEQGFHEYHWGSGLGKIEESFPQARAWLETAPEPFFLFLHTYESHRPYTRGMFASGPAEGEANDIIPRLFPDGTGRGIVLTREESLYVAALYDGGVRVACDATADLFADLDRLGLWESSVVVVLSDHGEEFGEHFPAYATHGHSLYEELLRVPFAVYHPGGGTYRNVRPAVSLVDLTPTVFDLLEISDTPPVDGESLVPLLQGDQMTRRLPIMANLANGTPWRILCVLSGHLKYLDTRTNEDVDPSSALQSIEYPRGIEVYRLDTDPQEGTNLAAKAPDLTAALRDTLQSALQRALPPIRDGSARGQVRAGKDLATQLRALGYVE